MTTFVLIHGAYHGGWCWYEVATELEARGHGTVTTDLPAHGGEPTAADAVCFEDYVKHVVGLVEATPDETVLVGHSIAGMVVTQVAEAYPRAVDTLVQVRCEEDRAITASQQDTMLEGRGAGEWGASVAERAYLYPVGIVTQWRQFLPSSTTCSSDPPSRTSRRCCRTMHRTSHRSG